MTEDAPSHLYTVPEQPERWAIVAIMGRQERIGRISEAMVAGTPMLRVDVPLEDGSFSTHDLGGSAFYEITYVDEQTARALAKERPAHPISIWTAQRLGLAPKSELPEGRDPDTVEDPEFPF